MARVCSSAAAQGLPRPEATVAGTGRGHKLFSRRSAGLGDGGIVRFRLRGAPALSGHGQPTARGEALAAVLETQVESAPRLDFLLAARELFVPSRSHGLPTRPEMERSTARTS